jgi:hypothetical protein
LHPQRGLLMNQLAIPLSNHKTVAKWLVIRANGLFSKQVSDLYTVRAEPVEAWAVFYKFNCVF